MRDQDRTGQSFEPDLRAADDLAAAAMCQDTTAPSAADPVPLPGRWRLGPIVMLVSFVVAASQLPALRAAFKTPPSIRVGAAPTDEDTDACVDSLWKVSSLLQYGTFRGNEVAEPVSGRPYVVRHANGETIVECPNPALHKLRSLQVSSAHRAPEAIP